MKRNLLFLSAFFFLFINGGCMKDNDGCKMKTVQSEEGTITSYATTNGITATAHSSGLYYQVTSPGSGATPTLSSKVFVKYTGKLLNGTVFDSQTNATLTGFTVSGLIQGWQIGLGLIKKGGTIKLIVPSSLAYGCQGSGSTIPGNSVLYFEIELVDVQ